MKNKHRNMRPAGRRVTASERKPRKAPAEQMPFKWVLLVPAIVLAGLWAGYHFTHSGGGNSVATAAPPQSATSAGPRADAGASASPRLKDAPARTAAPSDKPASGDPEPSQGGKTFVM